MNKTRLTIHLWYDTFLDHLTLLQHYAAGAGHKDAVKFLISKNASVNLQNMMGDTPLHRVRP